jgi:adenylate cyclase
MQMAFSSSPWMRARNWLRHGGYTLWAPLAALFVVVLVENTDPVLRLEYLTVNLRYQARAPFDPPSDPRLLFVGIDQQSLDKYGAWPWPRSVEADFLKIIQATSSPHVVSFDILFTEDFDKGHTLKSVSGADFDQTFADAAGQLPCVITGAFSMDPLKDASEQKTAVQQTQAELAQPSLTQPYTHVIGDVHRLGGSDVAVLPVRPLRALTFFGFVNDEPSHIDDIRHTLPMVMRVGDKVYPSLSLQTLCQMLNIDSDKVEIEVGKQVTLRNHSGRSWKIPINEKGEMIINYRVENVANISFVKLLETLKVNALRGDPIPPECQIDKKTLLVGGAAIGLTDLGPTPLAARTPLAYTHLNAINNILQQDFLHIVPWGWTVACWLTVTWATLFGLRRASLVKAVLVPLLIAILYVVLAFLIFALWSLEIALAWPLIAYGSVNFGAIVLRWREEQRGREQIKQVFSRMLSPEVMNHLLEHPENLNMGGAERAVTILFSDIRDYTKFSEGLKPAEVLRQLNLYFEPMVACVKENRGTLHKYIGDAIMAAWGDIAVTSLGPKKDTRNAVLSALMMRRKLRELNEERRANGLIPLRIGIGLNHGDDVVAGLLGASSRSEFTVIGDAVNTASRLEGLTKEFHTDLAISESVRNLIGDEFHVRRLGLIVLKGKTKPTVVYEVLAEKNEPGESKLTPETVAQYEAAFDHFLARRFAEAATGFEACEKSYPDDYCIKKYLEASRQFSLQPPPPDWDGRIVMETK